MDKPSNLHVTVVFKGIDSSDSVKDYAAKRVTKVSKHLHEMTNCHFTFMNERKESVAQLHIVAGDFEAKAEARGETFFAAIDEVTDKALHQSRKHKDKVTDHKKDDKNRIQFELEEVDE
ncbi:MAG: ribosome-associated translation inhibitor RaiA [Bdellovibrionota bacterium]